MNFPKDYHGPPKLECLIKDKVWGPELAYLFRSGPELTGELHVSHNVFTGENSRGGNEYRLEIGTLSVLQQMRWRRAVPATQETFICMIAMAKSHCASSF